MPSIRAKKIKNKEYLYAEYSFRLSDKKVKKISKLVKSLDEKDTKLVRNYFYEKRISAFMDAAEDKYEPDYVFTSEKIRKIEAMKERLRLILSSMTPAQKKDMIDRFTVNFTYESNALEGNSLTLKDVTFILVENIVPKAKDLREVYETRNTREANELLFSNKIKITIKDIVKLHSLLVRNTGVAFGFKKLPNYLLMRRTKTTAPEKVVQEMQELVEWYEKIRHRMHPLRIAAEFHARFEKIHPFEDGNGRVGRIIINAILLEHHYPPLIIRKTMRVAYFNALEAFDNGYKRKFERFLMERLEKTYKNFFEEYFKYI